MKKLFFSLLTLCVLAVGALAQTLTAYPQTSQAPSKNGIAVLTTTGDPRACTCDPASVENGIPQTYAGYLEVWFSTVSNGDATATPATAVRAKILTFDLDGSGNGRFILAVPESGIGGGNNPYVQIMQDNGGSYSQFQQFQVALGTGGVLQSRPLFWLDFAGAAPVGSIKALAKEKIIQPQGTNTLLDAENGGASVFLVRVQLHGILPIASSPNPFIEITSPGKVTSTLSGGGVTVTRVSKEENITELTFELPSQFSPVTGSAGFDIALRVKMGSAGTYSDYAYITVE